MYKNNTFTITDVQKCPYGKSVRISQILHKGDIIHTDLK